jgi:anhydro-N-acetylmuramic acid kinase
MNSPWTIAGIMSGTSLDGLDIAVCRFEEAGGLWQFEILEAATLPYTDPWRNRLTSAFGEDAWSLAKLHSDYGKYIGECSREFFKAKGIQPQLIASHGHTIFHRPEEGVSFQLGCGAAIAAATGITTVCDFRTLDVALGGQGAPLVPVGDHYLFGGHKFCLNLGGFANISFEKDGKRLAFDICPANTALNYLASRRGLEFDSGGDLAMNGQIIPELLDQMNSLAFYHQQGPKSLGREWFEKAFLPLISNGNYSIEDRLRTTVEHIGMQIGNCLFLAPGTTLFTTGGGAFNHFLIETIEEHISRHGIHVVVPDSNVVQFKEALIFAFLGLLRHLGRTNVFSSVTGAEKDSSSGAVYGG